MIARRIRSPTVVRDDVMRRRVANLRIQSWFALFLITTAIRAPGRPLTPTLLYVLK
jgi:hypothetical protein